MNGIDILSVTPAFKDHGNDFSDEMSAEINSLLVIPPFKDCGNDFSDEMSAEINRSISEIKTQFIIEHFKVSSFTETHEIGTGCFSYHQKAH